MKRLQYLAALYFALFFLAQGQNSDTLYFEDFEGTNPNFTSINIQSGASQWQVNSRLSFSGSQCVKVQPDTNQNSFIELITDTFNVPAGGFARLEWAQIAKLPSFPSLEGGRIFISTDNGNTWKLLNQQNVNYYGEGNAFSAINNVLFNLASYDTGTANNWLGPIDLPATNQQWKREGLDITNIVNNKINVMVKFQLRQASVFYPPMPDGWYMDDILIIRDSCEQFKPEIEAWSTNGSCTGVPVKNGLKVQTDSSYEVKVRIFDFTSVASAGFSFLDSAAIYYRNYSKNNKGSWQSQAMQSLGNGVHKHDFKGIVPGDTIQYYIEAVDNSCIPNTAHYPIIAHRDSSYLIYPEPLPGKCGFPFCDISPGIINEFPWKEDFEGSAWTAGTGNGQSGSAIRGEFSDRGWQGPSFTIKPNDKQAGYGWAVRSGSTPTAKTGPNKNHTPGGFKYLYTEADQGGAQAFTQLRTPCIDLKSDSTPKTLSFYYHRFGADMPDLRIDVDTGISGSQWVLDFDRITGQNQITTGDPWKKKEINLAPFVGEIVRVRLFAEKVNANDKLGDMAIDDMAIQDGLASDISLKAAFAFQDSSCFNNSSQVPLAVTLQNLGQQTVDSIPLVISITRNSNTTLTRDTLLANLKTIDGAKSFTLNKTVNLSQSGNYLLRVYADWNQDLNRSNDSTLVQAFAVRPAITQYPFTEDFEQAGVPQSQDFTQTVFRPVIQNQQLLTWKIGEKFTPTKGTGPVSGFYRKGKYAYVSAPASLNQFESALESNACFDLSSLSNPAISFGYHAYGVKIRELELQARKVGGDWTSVTTISSFSFNSEIDEWKFAVASLNAFKNENIQIRFIAEIGSTSGAKDNLAIDQITVYDQGSNDVGITAISRPGEAVLANLNLTPLRPTVTITNYGSSNQSGLKTEMSVRRLCDSQGQVLTFTDPGSVTVNANSSSVHLSQIPLVLPPGACEVCAYLKNNTGDSNRANDTVCRVITGRGTFTPPYKATFDSCRYEKDGFASVSGLLQWEKGKPSGSAISAAQSSPNAWVTDLSGGYTNQLDEELRTPNFDSINTKAGVKIRFWQYLDQAPWARLEYKTGQGWFPIGNALDRREWKNWYNSSFGSVNAQAFGGNSNGWKLSEAPLRGPQPLPIDLTMRFNLTAGSSTNPPQNVGEGWGIDDFEIVVPPQNSVSPQRIVLPNLFPLQGQQPFALEFKNTGEKILTQWKAEVFVNGAFQDSATFTNKRLVSGQSKSLSFPRPLTLNNGTNNVMIVTSIPNGLTDEIPFDDTARFSINVAPVLDTNLACDNFENEGFMVRQFSAGVTGLWERAAPRKTNLSSANSGTKAWVTSDSSNYPNAAKEFLFTPEYRIQKGLCYKLSFFHQFATEQNFDGGTVEFFIPGVTSGWTVLGSHDPNDSLWFNTPHIQAMNGLRPGWTGNNGSWQKAQYQFTATDTGTVRFRFHFASGGSVTGEGWAIDDICIEEVGTKCDSTVSLREIAQQNHLQVYPNPAQNTLHLEWLQSPTDAGLVQVVNTQGKLMYSQPAWQSPELTIDVSSWSSGIYFVIVRGKGTPIRRKIMVR